MYGSYLCYKNSNFTLMLVPLCILRYVESGHVQEVKYSDDPDSPYCFLKAGIIPSMRTKDKPHMAWVCLSKETADVYCAHCTCMAGYVLCIRNIKYYKITFQHHLNDLL